MYNTVTRAAWAAYYNRGVAPFAENSRGRRLPVNPRGGGWLFAKSRIESEPISPELQAFKNFFKTDMRIKR